MLVNISQVKLRFAFLATFPTKKNTIKLTFFFSEYLDKIKNVEIYGIDLNESAKIRNIIEKSKPKMTKEMGYISNVKDARKSLENIFKNS